MESVTAQVKLGLRLGTLVLSHVRIVAIVSDYLRRFCWPSVALGMKVNFQLGMREAAFVNER